MFISADQILAHLVGDYVLQSDWMADRKTQSIWVAMVHATTYVVPFLFFAPSLGAVAMMWITHTYIDRYRLARYLVWLKNWIGPKHRNSNWANCTKTGYQNYRPEWLTVWLLIIVDNILHLTINGAALKYLR